MKGVNPNAYRENVKILLLQELHVLVLFWSEYISSFPLSTLKNKEIEL